MSDASETSARHHVYVREHFAVRLLPPRGLRAMANSTCLFALVLPEDDRSIAIRWRIGGAHASFAAQALDVQAGIT